ncbi:MAG: uracil-DNA glycosylase family protein [Hyphomonas sp.]|uniref:uracil-DNA glycosylase family protein n=1 Tax=Hyphomonas sp. TaxID=87 RepID=UPI003002A493
MSDDLQPYLDQIRACRLCASEMSRVPNPVLQASSTARILVAGQAPGNLADITGIPFNDPSGKRLRAWMGVTDEEFYDASRIAIIPMGFCFPGYDSRGADRPPMKRCAEAWRAGLLQRLPDLRVTILVGAPAQKWHLGPRIGKTLTETVSKWQKYTSDQVFTTPHPSWRNTVWLKRNPWFELELLPDLRGAVRVALAS